MTEEIKNGTSAPEIDEFDQLLEEYSQQPKEEPKKEEPTKEDPKQEEELDDLDKLIEEKLGEVEEPKPDEITDEDIKKQIEELRKKSATAEAELQEVKQNSQKTQEEQTAIQENNLKAAVIDKELGQINAEALQLANYKKSLVKALDDNEITAVQFDEYNTKISTRLIQLNTIAGQKLQEKQSIPSVEQFQQIQQVRQKNNEYYTKYSENIKDDLVKKHIDKLKTEHYDQYGQPLENNPTFETNKAWIEQILKDGEQRGYQRAIERIAEKKAKGKLNVPTGGTKGETVKKSAEFKSPEDALANFDAWNADD